MAIEKLEKINNLGEYTKFPGVTIISTIQEAPLWQELYQALQDNKLLCQYYAPLPYESYHMTTCNLYTQAHTRGNWLNFISENLDRFKLQEQWLENKSFKPIVKIQGLRTAGVLQLQLALTDSKQHQSIQQFAEQFNLESGVPEVFHITLAYNYKDILSQEEYDKIKETFTNLTLHLINKEIVLNPPTLCHFDSMKAFTNWDAENNPFIVSDRGLLSTVLNFFGEYFPSMREENRKKQLLKSF